MKINWRVEAVQVLLIAAMFVAAGCVWPQAPERMPIHWNVRGEVDGYGSKFLGLLMPPLVAAGLYLLLLFLPRIDPGYGNYQSFSRAYVAIRLALILFLAGLYGVTVLAAMGRPVDVAATSMAGVGALFVVLGNFMGKIRPNWFVGVRTPWTLSSKLSWTKTHRLAGWLFMAMGTLLFCAGLTRATWLFAIALTFSVTSVVWMIVYSYLVYRRDPERIPPAGTSPG